MHLLAARVCCEEESLAQVGDLDSVLPAVVLEEGDCGPVLEKERVSRHLVKVNASHLVDLVVVGSDHCRARKLSLDLGLKVKSP